MSPTTAARPARRCVSSTKQIEARRRELQEAETKRVSYGNADLGMLPGVRFGFATHGSRAPS